VKRWSSKSEERVEIPKVDAFLAEIEEVCRKHGMSIGHEDSHGAFIVYDEFNEDVMRWMHAARAEDKPI
jgi:hypothetical protein